MDLIILLILTIVLISRPHKGVKFIGMILLAISIIASIIKYNSVISDNFNLFFWIALFLIIFLLLQPNKNAKNVGKVMLGVMLAPVILFIILFAACLVIGGIGSIF